MVGRVLAFPMQSSSFPDGTPAAAKKILSTAVSERLERAVELAIQDPEVLLNLCGCVRELLYSDPTTARNEAAFFYRYLQTLDCKVGLFDEHDYFLGEFALIAGTACRQLSLRDDSRLWFERAEAGYRHTANAVADLTRLAYQRLALRMEERQLETVLELAPALIHGFAKLGMREDEVKARFLEAISLAESDRQDEATACYEEICRIAERIGAEHLFAQACGNLIHMAAMRGDTAAGIEYSRRALPGLRRSNDRVGLAKAQWGLANLLRESGQLQSAIEAYQEAQTQFARIEMRADTAAIHLILADIALELGRESDALRSILTALPVIEELGMVPEGVAAMALLRDSVRQHRVDRQALRELHGYFADLSST